MDPLDDICFFSIDSIFGHAKYDNSYNGRHLCTSDADLERRKNQSEMSSNT